ncbi:DUF1127 domain-containing protein [Acuticoccus kandeliae]|uniref:DUF1127 domain-containing protein n=1 Tax=Acuticoccus kandeliae TaxID=2073160 RepID=UPI000D3E29E5|nr:DUF1127 domain-containing protein [Acuticoccus kandeliae]
MEHVLSRATSPVSWGWRKVAALVRLWLDIWSERRALDRLDDRLLEDIGVARAEAARESARAPWDAPIERLNQTW